MIQLVSKSAGLDERISDLEDIFDGTCKRKAGAPRGQTPFFCLSATGATTLAKKSLFLVLLSVLVLVGALCIIHGGILLNDLDVFTTNGGIGLGSTANSSATTAHTETFKEDEKLEVRNSSCRILIRNIQVDYHYEVLESVALRYPLPWDELKYSCQDSGLSVNDPILVDYEISLYGVPESTWQTREGWYWKAYFEEHLTGRIRNRSDGKLIQFRSIVGKTQEEFQTIQWSSYAAEISASADTYPTTAFKRMAKHKFHFAVLHGINDIQPSYVENRTCQLNPQHYPHPKCWFLPTDFPKFSRPNPPYANGTNLRVCMPGKWSNVTSDLVQALHTIKPQKLKIILLGRKVSSFLSKFGNMSHYVETVDGVKDFWVFHKRVAECHAMISFIEPYGEAIKYFVKPNVTLLSSLSAGYMGKLSGHISHLIGYRIPSLLHKAVADIYRSELTARFYEFQDDTNSFVTAFQSLIDSFESEKRG